MDTETYDGSAHWAHPVKDSDGDWVRYEDAQAEIARLLAELETARKAAAEANKKWLNVAGRESDRNKKASEDYMALLKKFETEVELSDHLRSAMNTLGVSNTRSREADRAWRKARGL